MGLLNPGGPIAQFKRNRCSISPVELILQSGVRILLLAMLLSLSAYAASPRVMTILPAISFDGTTANCRVSVSADRSTDQISAVIQLWNGSTRIARWTDSGTGYLLFSNSATVSKGKTYELTVDVKINGVSKPQVSIEGTCK